MAGSKPKLTEVERLVLVNQYRLLSALDKKESEYYDYASKILILENGFEDHYHEIFGMLGDPPPATLCRDVANIMNLFDAIYESTKRKPPEPLRFLGFDSNTENEALKYAEFLYKRGGFKFIPRPENSHAPVMRAYMRMVRRRKEWKEGSFLLSQEQLADLISARSMQ